MYPFFISDYKVLCCYLPLSISSLSSSQLRKGDFIAATETKRFFHTSTVFMVGISDCAQQNLKINPWFVTGFVDAEGCFHVSITENKELNLGWRVQSRFQISLHTKDRPVLEEIKNFLGAGEICRLGPNSLQFRIIDPKDLARVYYHFKKLQLITQKKADYELWCEVMDLIERCEHLTKEGLYKIVAIRASMNLGLSEKLQLAFPNVVPVERPKVETPKTIDPQWLAGFTSGEGCFLISIRKSKTKLGEAVQLELKIVQDHRDEQLISYLIKYFNCGKTYKYRTWIVFKVTKFDDIQNKIIPFFKKHPIRGVKALDFADLCLAAELIKKKAHLTKEGLDQIKKIKAGMNTGRKLDY